MQSQKAAWFACALALAFSAGCGHSQTLTQIPTQITPHTTEDALHEMAQQAAVIFSGQVVAIRHHDGANDGTGIVEIDFVIADAIRGATGGTYTLREWAGLWQTGNVPFSVGRQYLMLLHAPGPSGLSSPVGGMDGAIPVRGGSQPTPFLASSQVSGSTLVSTSTDSRVIDLRWVGVRVDRPLAYRPESVARQTALPVSVRAYAVIRNATAAGESDSSRTSQAADFGVSVVNTEAAPPNPSSASQFTPYTATLAKLRAWEKNDDAAR